MKPVVPSLWTALLLAGGSLLWAGCRTAEPPTRTPRDLQATLQVLRTNAPPQPTETPLPRLGLGWEPYQDAQLSFDRPVGGKVEPLDDAGSLRVLGPLVPPGYLGYAESEGEIPAFEVLITRHPNPEGLSPEAWGRKQVLDALATVEAEDGPRGGLPVDEGGAIREDKVATTTIGGRPAFRVVFFHFDSEGHETYVADGADMVTFSHAVNIPGNVPIADDQTAACTHILDSVRWAEAR